MVFNQVVGGFLAPRPVYAHPAPVVIERPVPVYRQVIVTTPPPPAPIYRNVVYYPHGRYELRGDGVYTAYQWVWIPSAAARAAGASPSAAAVVSPRLRRRWARWSG